ncbi:ferrous iron transport protein A [bacterium]|nr:MAG: ferrous iron transport protein A [bacterium]
MAVSSALTFSTLRQGMSARVVQTPRADGESARLQEMGLTKGTTFRVVKVAPFGDPVEIDLRGYRLCLRKGETQGFEIEPA